MTKTTKDKIILLIRIVGFVISLIIFAMFMRENYLEGQKYGFKDGFDTGMRVAENQIYEEFISSADQYNHMRVRIWDGYRKKSAAFFCRRDLESY